MDSYLDASAVPYSPAGMRSLGVDPAPSASTLHRWRLRGVRGTRVTGTFLRGGRRWVTPQAMRQFFAQANRDAPEPAICTTKSGGPSARADAANAALDQAGI